MPKAKKNKNKKISHESPTSTNPVPATGTLPPGWQWKRLGEICETTSGGTPNRKNPAYYENGTIPWVKSGELGRGKIFDVEERITELALKNSSAKVFPAGTLLIALYGATIGKLGFLGISAATNQAVCGIFENPCISLSYLFYFLTYSRPVLIQKGMGGAQPNISQTILKNLPIPLPPLDEQKQIVAKIEELFSDLDRGVEALKTAREQLKVYRQSILQSAFSGKLTSTKESSEIPHESPTPTNPVPEGWQKNFLGNLCEMYQPKTISTRQLKDDGAYFVYGANGIIGRYDKFNHEKSELLITCRGTTCGAVNVSKPCSWINGNAMVVRPLDEALNREFLSYFFRQNGVLKNAITGTAQPQITRTTLQKIEIMLPREICEQKRIVAEIESRFSACDKLEESINLALSQSATLRQSILARAFSGNLL